MQAYGDFNATGDLTQHLNTQEKNSGYNGVYLFYTAREVSVASLCFTVKIRELLYTKKYKCNFLSDRHHQFSLWTGLMCMFDSLLLQVHSPASVF